MAVPTYDDMIDPLLRVLARAPDGLLSTEAAARVADLMRLTNEDRDELLPSGKQPVFRNRVGWANHRLKRALLSASPKRGLWQITQAGVEFVRAHPVPLSKDEAWTLAYLPRVSRLSSDDTDDDSPPPSRASSQTIPPVHSPESPSDLIDRALAEIRDSVRFDLLEHIMRATPKFFEGLVLDLLHSMGYGASRADLKRTGGSSDGGIDGVISLDKLGLEKVYVQAKRWSGNVGSPEVQTFMGALQLQGANKGVLLTTSAFTREAKVSAERAYGRIVLIDGERLAGLMIDHGVGVQPKPINIPRIDSDYFDDEE